MGFQTFLSCIIVAYTLRTLYTQYIAHFIFIYNGRANDYLLITSENEIVITAYQLSGDISNGVV